MKFYNLNLSNFATKSRIVIYDKGANIEICPLPGGSPGSPEYAAINPIAKVPCLDADGVIIPESELINEYLEEKFPTPPLLPKGPEARAKVRLLSRFNDLYVDPPMRALFGQLNPKTHDDKVVTEKLAELQRRLDQLEAMLAPPGNFACGPEFTLADCALAPTTFFLVNLLPGFGAKPAIEGRPKLAAWWEKVNTRPSVKKAVAEQAEALKAMMGGGR